MRITIPHLTAGVEPAPRGWRKGHGDDVSVGNCDAYVGEQATCLLRVGIICESMQSGYKGLYFYNEARLQNAMSLHGDNIVDPDFTHKAQTHTVTNPT